jgi:hypothetical protein
MPSLLLVKGEGCRNSLLQRMSPFMANSVEKVGVLTRPIFLAPWVRFSDSDAGGLIIHLRLNGANSKSICGGNKRQPKTSLVF